MISISEAIEIIQNNLQILKTEMVELSDCLGKVLAVDILSPENSPKYINSAMDGFAVKWDDVKSLTDVNSIKLRIIGESQAGIPFVGLIQTGEAIAINTGAMLPNDTDSVIPIEECELKGNEISVLKVNKFAQNVRLEGEEILSGALIFKAGTKINSAKIAMMAAFGISSVQVYKMPKVAIVVTGTELVDYNQQAESYQIRDSNSIMLAKAVIESGGIITEIHKVKDSLESTIKKMNEIQKDNDIILFSGGVSVGEHDHVKNAAKEVGYEELFWRVKQKPGKPLYFAKKEETLLFGLPGNPVSAYMCYSYYIHPTIKKMTGEEFELSTLTGVLEIQYASKSNRAQLLRIKIDDVENDLPKITILKRQASHMISTIAYADGYIVVEENQIITENSRVKVYLFPWGR